jgi:hypothetical protein
MKLWIIMARSVNKVFDSKEKADRYVREQENKENLPNEVDLIVLLRNGKLNDRGCDAARVGISSGN